MVTRVGKEYVSIYGTWMACVADVSKTEILVRSTYYLFGEPRIRKGSLNSPVKSQVATSTTPPPHRWQGTSADTGRSDSLTSSLRFRRSLVHWRRRKGLDSEVTANKRRLLGLYSARGLPRRGRVRILPGPRQRLFKCVCRSNPI